MSGRSDQYPRVLIIGHDFDAQGAGITMSCLFKEWPRDRIAVTTGAESLGQSGFAGRYYRLGVLEDRWIWPFSAVPRESWKISGPVAPGAARDHDDQDAASDRRPPGTLRPRGHAGNSLRRIGSAALRVAEVDNLLRGLHLSDPFLAWVAEFRPDVIYSPLSLLRLVGLVGELVQETDIPLALHFLDDWPSTLHQRGPMAPILRRRLGTELRALIERAAVLMAISDDMSREFETRYGRPFQTFHNALELGAWGPTRRTTWEVGGTLEVLYAGGLGVANQTSMLDVAEAIERLAATAMGIRFTVLTPDLTHPVAQALRQFAHVDLSPGIPHRDMPARLAAADLLVLPLDLEGQNVQFTRFSMPTKTVEYMASGTPTLVYAPAEHAVSRYATTEGWAWVVGRRDPQALADGFRVLAESAEKREHLARRAMELALERHDAQAVRARFRGALESAAASRPCLTTE
jgi:glycosyltransferase involved in cell wall biosynthesis